MAKSLILLAAASFFALLASAPPASARACKRICMQGQCWYDCSKIPGQPAQPWSNRPAIRNNDSGGGDGGAGYGGMGGLRRR